ncbi:TIGR01777 family oxidoreductase [Calditerricola satsumensis]|uniref:Epimerase n=1 Tax=Calditerricola satsumensis TaxID=373054 RepID=A0A8J3BCF0_9BACI|nr:TIGR01777 family oxidoreductase [Calditerricola satsumensis]GGJ97717.1 epimerase [Calditerricola satsumensis]
MRIIVTGGTGLIGRALVSDLLDAGHRVTVLTRNVASAARKVDPRADVAEWLNGSGWERHLSCSDAVIHLAGETINQRWTYKAKRRILESRVGSTRALVQALQGASPRPRVLISASAVGIYGSTSEPVDETAPAGDGFLATVCQAWEAAAWEAKGCGVRVVLLRLGIVLSPEGGALVRLLLPFRLFLGGPLGSGTQPFPWIHYRDVIELVRFCLDRPDASGPINAVAPEPHTQASFARELGRALGRPSWLHVPGLVLRAVFGEMAEALLLSGQAVTPAKALQLGYRFRYPDLAGALNDLLGNRPRAQQK